MTNLRFAALVALLSPMPALAQAVQCVPPARIDNYPPITPDGPTRRVPIGGYSLALSWSPEFCRTARGPGSVLQCGGGNGRFGFVVHGLWPEAANGPPPQWCAFAPNARVPRPSPDLLRRNLCMTPSARTLEHEWLKHGSCAARTPEDYFAASARLWQGLHMPDAAAMARQPRLTVGDLRAAFVAANPSLPADAIGVKINPGGWLREVTLCYSASLKPTACQRDQLGARDQLPLRIGLGGQSGAENPYRESGRANRAYENSGFRREER